jgi:dolichol-phosphate mannosyltransferase
MISVILPTYNESENIRVIVPRIFDVLTRSRLEGEIIVVDDNSPDRTAEVAAGFAKAYRVRVHVRKNDRGLATAVIKGFELASGDIYVVMDADLSHPVERIPEMVKPILEGECEATVGSRYTCGGGCEDWPFRRRFISKVSGLLARGLSRLSDPTSGFMAIRRDALNGVTLDPIGWKIVLEVIVKTGAKFQEVPIVFADREKGESKLDTRVQAQYIAHLWKLYLFKYPVAFQFLKFCIVGFLGLLLDTAVLVALVEFVHLDPRIAAVFGFLCAVSANYVLNRSWTFDTARATRIATSYAWFVAVCIAGLFVRLGVMHLLIEFFNMGLGYRYVLASIIGIFVATIFNFVGTKFVAFSNKLKWEKNVT